MLLTLLRSARTLLIPVWGVHLGLGASEIGIILSLAAGFDMIMFPIAGLIMDRLGRRWSATACIALLGLGLGLIPFTTTPIAFANRSHSGGYRQWLGQRDQYDPWHRPRARRRSRKIFRDLEAHRRLRVAHWAKRHWFPCIRLVAEKRDLAGCRKWALGDRRALANGS